jgi:hypothetical protein
MRVFISVDPYGVTDYFNRLSDVHDEINQFMENALPGDSIKYSVSEMTEEQYNALPEIQG